MPHWFFPILRAPQRPNSAAPRAPQLEQQGGYAAQHMSRPPIQCSLTAAAGLADSAEEVSPTDAAASVVGPSQPSVNEVAKDEPRDDAVAPDPVTDGAPCSAFKAKDWSAVFRSLKERSR